MDTEAYERVVVENKDRIHGYAAAMLRDRTDAQDVAQEALIRMWKHRDNVAADHAPYWLRRTAHNLCIDRIRRRRFSADLDDDTIESTMPDTRETPEGAASADELGGQIEEALGRLQPAERAVVVMREIQGMSYAEIAQVLDVPLGTLKARLHRAREQLRRILVRAGVTP